jgi:hypothetical protein
MTKSVGYLCCTRHNGSHNHGSIAATHLSRLLRCTIDFRNGSKAAHLFNGRRLLSPAADMAPLGPRPSNHSVGDCEHRRLALSITNNRTEDETGTRQATRHYGLNFSRGFDRLVHQARSHTTRRVILMVPIVFDRPAKPPKPQPPRPPAPPPPRRQ